MPWVTSTAPKETPMRKARSWTRKMLPSIRLDQFAAFVGRFGQGHAAQQDEELVAADASQQMLVAQRLTILVAQLAQHFVAGGVAEQVIDGLEAVEVHVGQGEGVTAPAEDRAAQRLLDRAPRERAR
jgi:hypothetical protein